MNDQDRDLKQACRFVLSRPLPPPAADTLARLAAHAAAEAADEYGAGGAVARLEQATVERLGKDAGLFFIKGVTAQLCVLRAHAQARGCRNVVIHPMSHMDIDEAGAIERVTDLKVIRLGRFLPFTAPMLDALTEPLAAVVVELPLRRAGFLLPPIDALRAISAWCRERHVPLHLDGARLWETAAGYGLSVAELAALADSVYVSYYKGLGGLGGALVAGGDAFVHSLRVWKTRYGGDLSTAWPYAIAALDGLEHQAPRLGEFVARARALAAALAGLPGLLVHPNPPHTNAFQLWLPGTPSALAERHRQFAAEHRCWLFDAFAEAPLAGHAMAEVQIGPASDHYRTPQAIAAVNQFLAYGSPTSQP
ncbi:MAG: threonine aldolase [Pseudomonadota bacterium]|nr:threonine aldolase [Xanthomonadaceae bacterium]MDE2247586.1 threonine aldolase [Xanthomonadaceae bacterium]MDE3211102.1 threonine aldolase [Pseudomonadota bacterium]